MATNGRWASLLAMVVVLGGTGARDASAQNVNVSGVVYAQYGYETSDAADGANAFDVKRAYLNFLGKFEHGVNTRVTTDLYRNADGSLSFRLKYGYVTFTPEHSPLTLKFGQIHTPWVDWEEGLWGYRMQGPIALDRAGYLTSSDIGAGVDGAWQDQKVNLQVTLTNGEGYHAAEGDKHKDLAARASVRLLASDDGGSRGGLRVTALGHVGSRTGGGTRNRLVGMMSYKSRLVTLAGEAARVTNSATSSDPDVDGNVYSFFGVLNPKGSDLGLIARVDVTDPNTDATDDRSTRFIGGISCRLSPNLLLLADLDRVSYQDGRAAASTLLFQTQVTF